MLGLGVLAALVALAAAFFGNCIPGFGVGGTAAPAPSTSTTQPAAQRGPADADADALALSVDADRCRRGTDAATPCSELCTALAGEPKTRKILVDGTLGTQAAVDDLRRCLDSAGFRNVVVRTE